MQKKYNVVSQATWRKIKNEYIFGNLSYGELSKKYGVPRTTIGAKGKKEGWVRECNEITDNIRQMTKEKLVEKSVNANEQAMDIFNEVLSKLSEASKSIDPMDTVGIKQIVSSMKELKEMGVIYIDKKDDDEIIVRFEDEVDDYVD